jgi:hypothetical protein
MQKNDKYKILYVSCFQSGRGGTQLNKALLIQDNILFLKLEDGSLFLIPNRIFSILVTLLAYKRAN